MARWRLPRLLLRDGTFYFRATIPLSLRSLLGRSELKLSLRTRDPMVARLRCGDLSNRFDRYSVAVSRMKALTPEIAKDLLRAYFEEGLKKINETVWAAPLDPEFVSATEIELSQSEMETLRKRIVARQVDNALITEARELVDGAGVAHSGKVDENFEIVCTGILRARAEHRRILIAMLQGKNDQIAPHDPLFAGITTLAMPPIPGDSTPQQHTVGFLAQRFQAQKTKTKEWVIKTANEHKRVLELFCEIIGPSKPIKLVSEDDVRAFRDALLVMPPNYSKQSEYSGKTVKEILKLATGKTDGLAPKTAQKYLDNLHTFFNWAMEEGYIDKRPGKSIKLKKKASAIDARHPFSEDQIAALFSSPAFLGHLTKEQRSKSGTILIRDGKYWVPLLGLFTGMRLGEIVQLLVTDIKSQDETTYIQIAKLEGENKQLKTLSSARSVPVHPMLTKLGLLDYVEQRRKEDPKGRIFADIAPGKDGYFSHNFSKWFARYSKAIGLKSKKTAFHSFRHNFKDALVQAGVEDSHIRALLGHADHSVTGSYGSKLKPSILAADVAKIAYKLPPELFSAAKSAS